MKKKIERLKIVNLLKSVWLDGEINECVLKIVHGVGSIVAIDPTNSIFVQVKTKIELVDKKINKEIGILDIGTIIKFLDSCKESSKIMYEIEDKLIRFRVKGKGNIQFALGKIEVISTAIKDDLKKVNSVIESKTLMSFELNQEIIDRFKYFMGVLNNEIVRIEVSPNGGIIRSGAHESKSFDFNVEGGEFNKNTAISVNAKSLFSIFSLLPELGEKNYTVSLEKASPLIIKGDDVVWLLSPVGEE